MFEQNFMTFALIDFFSTLGRYILISIVPFYILSRFSTEYFSQFKIISPYKTKEKNEFFYSLLNFLFYCFADFFLLVMMKNWQLSKIYETFAQHGLIYEIKCLIILFFAQDISFYLIHRLLHLPWAFKKIHYIHHLSKNPTALCSYAFHPIEAISMSLFFILLVMFIPINIKTAGVFFVFSHIYNSYGHSGYDFKYKKKGWFDRWFSHSTRHNLHHRMNRGNFGLYTTIWDNLFKTKQNEIQ